MIHSAVVLVKIVSNQDVVRVHGYKCHFSEKWNYVQKSVDYTHKIKINKQDLREDPVSNSCQEKKTNLIK